ncbi:hypothetical protein OsI_31365 [Oryza sativa Indica Group]|uniref:Secreted protein n=1 Tax=Oryza sativa subsp. indica TaxID=39946 RepID=B8BF80_ORYSI|nr:hypothetical protein OsI_31365 [Oryza sativa Indica Group]
MAVLRVVVAAGLRVVLRAVVAGGLRVVVAPTPPCRHRLEVGGAECVDGDGVVQAEGRLVIVVAAPLQIPEGRGKTMGCAISLRTTVTAEPEGLRVIVAGRTTAMALGGWMRRAGSEPGWDGERGREREEREGGTHTR